MLIVIFDTAPVKIFILLFRFDFFAPLEHLTVKYLQAAAAAAAQNVQKLFGSKVCGLFSLPLSYILYLFSATCRAGMGDQFRDRE